MKRKLTLISISGNGHSLPEFHLCPVLEDGHTLIDTPILVDMMQRIGIQRGDGFTIS